MMNENLLFFIFIILVSVFGRIFFLKNEIEFKKNSFKNEVLTKIGTVFIGFYLFLLVFVLKTLFSLVLTLVFGLLLSVLSFYLLIWIENQKLKKNVLSFLIQIHLNMLSGNSFRKSFLDGKEVFDKKTEKVFSEMYEVVTFSQQKTTFFRSKFLTWVINEFIYIDSKPDNAISHILSLRKKLKLISDFRQRSREVTRSAMAQSIILSIIYVILLFVVGAYFGWKRNISFIVPSVIIFLLGLIWVLFFSRKIKWKI